MAGRVYVSRKPKRTLLEDPARRQRALEVSALLVEVGRVHGDQYPWHHAADPFRVLVAEYLLSRTARSTVKRVYEQLFALYPDAASLAGADETTFSALTREAGLATKTAGLLPLARVVADQGGVVPERGWLLGLPYVGDYIADAVLLYAFQVRTMPLDRNFQRVVHRVFFNQAPPRRSIEPYRDPETVYVVDEMTRDLDLQSLRWFHQGVLTVAWDHCRHNPRIAACPLSAHCRFAHDSLGALTNPRVSSDVP